jgi:predicted HTH transcriptional regulator
MAGHGLPEPVFQEVGQTFKVTFQGPGENILDLIPEEGVTDLHALGLNERQIKAMGYESLFGIARATALLDLNDLVVRGLLGAEGAGRGRLYVLAMARNA